MKIFKLFAMAALAVLAFSCEEPESSTEEPKEEQKQEEQPPVEKTLESIVISPASKTLEVGETVTLTLTLTPADFSKEGLAWDSDKKSVATVANGVVTAVAKGEANITATLSGKTATCKITVTKTETPPDDEWDGKTFVDRSAEWGLAFTDKGGWWAFELLSCTAPYHLIKYAQEGDDWIPYSVCHDPIDIARAYQFFCVDVDDSYLQGAVVSTIPDLEELLWPEGNGVATGYVFGFNDKKKFTGEYAILKSHSF